MGTALLVVDVQNDVADFVTDLDAVVATIAALVQAARTLDVPVVWVQHADEAMPYASHAWQIVAGLHPLPHELRIEKQHRSAFAETGLAEQLVAAGVDRVVLTGMQSAFCVDMAGKHALAEGFDVTLVSDGHANGDQETDAGVLSDAVVRALVNRTWASLEHPGRRVEVVEAATVTWL